MYQAVQMKSISTPIPTVGGDLTTYARRVLDDELDELLSEIAAVSIEGPKGVGKTATALQRARTVHRLDDAAAREIAAADPAQLLAGRTPILVDEWQRLPESWDLVRRAVDRDASANRFILTGSATPSTPPTHSGAGRIVRVRMRPLSLAERSIESPTVSLGELLQGRRPAVSGQTGVTLRRYATEIVASGFPGLRHLSGRALRTQLKSYVSRIVDTDFEDAGHAVRKPQLLLRWMTAYAAATSTTASFETIRDAATHGDRDKPTRPATIPYREVLERLWILDPVPAWLPTRNYFSRLAHPPKHHLADPALAAALLGVGVDTLLQGGDGGVDVPREGTLLGHLFESLMTLCVRVYAQAAEAEVRHLRTKGGRNEVDLIVERADHKILAAEVKLARTVTDDDVRQLVWLQARLGTDFLDGVIITTGSHAYRRPDGIAVVPASLLGP
jgi:hypothetical protein